MAFGFRKSVEKEDQESPSYEIPNEKWKVSFGRSPEPTLPRIVRRPAGTAAGHILVLNPTAPPRELRHSLAARPADLRGQSIGFLWNTKPNGDLLFARLEELLRRKYEISGVLHRSKPTSSVPAAGPVLNELAGSIQAAIVGLGD